MWFFGEFMFTNTCSSVNWNFTIKFFSILPYPLTNSVCVCVLNHGIKRIYDKLFHISNQTLSSSPPPLLRKRSQLSNCDCELFYCLLSYRTSNAWMTHCDFQYIRIIKSIFLFTHTQWTSDDFFLFNHWL